MSIDTTENDEAIARMLAEDYELVRIIFDNFYWLIFSNLSRQSKFFNAKRSASSSESCSSDSSKKLKVVDIQQKFDISSSNKENSNSIQINEDEEMALILQIEEIVLSENKIDEKTIK